MHQIRLEELKNTMDKTAQKCLKFKSTQDIRLGREILFAVHGEDRLAVLKTWREALGTATGVDGTLIPSTIAYISIKMANVFIKWITKAIDECKNGKITKDDLGNLIPAIIDRYFSYNITGNILMTALLNIAERTPGQDPARAILGFAASTAAGAELTASFGVVDGMFEIFFETIPDPFQIADTAS